MTGMTAAMIMAAKEVDGMYWKRELRTARASSTILPTDKRGQNIFSVLTIDITVYQCEWIPGNLVNWKLIHNEDIIALV